MCLEGTTVYPLKGVYGNNAGGTLTTVCVMVLPSVCCLEQ